MAVTLCASIIVAATVVPPDSLLARTKGWGRFDESVSVVIYGQN
jgi:hypothetical protein